jgi:hypothetical protein
MLGRRKFLGTVGATATVLAAARTLSEPGGGSGGAGTVSEPLAAAGVLPRARFGACEVVSLESMKDGAVSVRFADSAGRPFEVELLGYDSRTPGVARAGSLGVYLNNKGRGSTATIEEHGLAAMALARHLARRQASGAKLPVLPTLAERFPEASSA